MVTLSVTLVLAALCRYVLGAPAALTRRQALDGVPQYVLDHAPLVWLDEDEAYFPADIAAQLAHTHPTNGTNPIDNAPSPLTLENLNSLGDNVFLTSNDDFSKNPTWLTGVKPDSNGKTNEAISCAVIVHDKGGGIVDAFYMYFFAYNQGNTVFGQELGDHIGDWEHNAIRFVNSEPQQVWFSEHSNGEAFEWNAVEKQGNRLVAYSAKGTHANWATAGSHDHTIPDVSTPFGPLIDTTSQGTLWDTIASAYFYNVTFPSDAAADDSSNPTFQAYGDAPVEWLSFAGKWGDKQLPKSDSRQKEFFGFYKYTDGPTGPRDKQLNRNKICPNNGIPCIVRSVITPGARMR